MKKIFLASLAILALNSCRKDDEDTNSVQNLIVGTWKIVKYVEISGSNNSTISSELVTGCEASNRYTFASNNSFTFNYFTPPTSGSGCVSDGTETGTYTYNSNTKILALNFSDGSTDNGEIKSITSNEMVLIGDQDDFNNDGVIDKTYIYFNK